MAAIGSRASSGLSKLLLIGAIASLKACAAPVSPPPLPSGSRDFSARGNEPGWTLNIQNDMIDYRGDYGETRITAPRRPPRTRLNGHRYETPRLIVDVTHRRCNDDMSGWGYTHQVMVTADGKTVRGCGGARRKDWDI